VLRPATGALRAPAQDKVNLKIASTFLLMQISTPPHPELGAKRHVEVRKALM